MALTPPHACHAGVHALDCVPAVRAATAGRPTVVVLTAHPAKFDEAVRQAGLQPEAVPRVEALKRRPHRFRWLRAPGRGQPPVPRAQKLAMWAEELKGAVERAAAERGSRPRAKL